MAWIEVTEEFLDDLHKVEQGELLLADDFGLEGALAAIDLMDPKMDRGMARQDGEFIATFRSEFLNRMPYTMELVQEDAPMQLSIQAMDALFSLESTWYTGLKSFAETILTFLPAHRPFYIQNEPLRLYILATLRTCQIIEGIVRQANVCGGEEFFRNTFESLPEAEDERDEVSAANIVDEIKLCISVYAEHRQLVRRLKRILLWLQIVHCVYTRGPLMKIDSLIDDLVQVSLSLLNDSNEEHEDSSEDYRREALGIYPSMANFFLHGCPRSTDAVPNLDHNKAISYQSNLALSFKFLTELAAAEEAVKFEKLISQLWSLKFNPILASALFLSLHENRAVCVTPLQIEAAVAAWLGLPKHARVNVTPIESYMMDLLQISCHSAYTQHANMHKLLHHIHRYFNKPDLKRDLYVLDYLRWWKLVMSVRVILLGFQLEIYEPYEFSEAFWVLSKLLSGLGVGRKSRFAFGLAKKLTSCGLIASYGHLYRDCRFHHRWRHILPLPADIAQFENEMILSQTEVDLDFAPTLIEKAIYDSALAEGNLDVSALMEYFSPDLITARSPQAVQLRNRQQAR